MSIGLYKVQSSFIYLIYTFRKRTLCQISYLSYLRSISESSEGWIYAIRKENKPSEGSQTLQNVELFRRLCREGWLLKGYNSWHTIPSKHLLHISRITFKSQMWHDKIQKSADKSEMLVNYQQLFFLFCDIFTYWEKKQLLLFLVLDQWIIKAESSRSAHLNEYILKSIKSWKTMKSWLDYWTFYALKDHSILFLSQPSKHPENYFL